MGEKNSEHTPFLNAKKDCNNHTLLDHILNPNFQLEKKSILSGSNDQKCELFKEKLKTGIKIENADQFNRLRSLLKEINIDIKNLNYSDLITRRDSFVNEILYFQMNKNDNNIEVFVDVGGLFSGLSGIIQHKGTIIENQYTERLYAIHQDQISNFQNLSLNYCTEEEKEKTTGEGDAQKENIDTLQTQETRDPTTPLETSNEKYRVKQGDSLWKIIKEQYKVKMSQSILDILEVVIKENEGLNQDTKLKIGETLNLPKLTSQEIQKIQETDKERRIAFNNEKGIKMKKDFK